MTTAAELIAYLKTVPPETLIEVVHAGECGGWSEALVLPTTSYETGYAYSVNCEMNPAREGGCIVPHGINYAPSGAELILGNAG